MGTRLRGAMIDSHNANGEAGHKIKHASPSVLSQLHPALMMYRAEAATHLHLRLVLQSRTAYMMMMPHLIYTPRLRTWRNNASIASVVRRNVTSGAMPQP